MDLNAKVELNNAGYEDIMERHGLGTWNKNSKIFANLYAPNKIIMISIYSPTNAYTKLRRSHRTILLRTKSTISDSIKFNRTIVDMQAKRGADPASDHHLMVYRTKLKLKKH